jgi:hypothetical protein
VWQYGTCHARHTRFTLHPRDDLQVVLPYRFGLKEWLLAGFIDPTDLVRMLRESLRLSLGRFGGEWELALYPLDDRERRRGSVRCARVLLAGHAAILAGAILAASLGFPRAL